MKRGFTPCYGPHQMIMESKPWFAAGSRASSGLHYHPLSSIIIGGNDARLFNYAEQR